MVPGSAGTSDTLNSYPTTQQFLNPPLANPGAPAAQPSTGALVHLPAFDPETMSLPGTEEILLTPAQLTYLTGEEEVDWD